MTHDTLLYKFRMMVVRGNLEEVYNETKNLRIKQTQLLWKHGK